MTTAKLICLSNKARGIKMTRSNCDLCRIRKTCKDKPYIKSDVDRDYDRAVNAEMNDSEHRRMR